MFYGVKLINDSLDNSYAEIIPYEKDNYVTFYVSSKNAKMKSHLEMILSRDAFILAPGKNTKTSFSDSAVHIYPNTLQYLQSLPEILSWNGYQAIFHKEVHKSFGFMDNDWHAVKAVNDEVYTNAQGERVVKYVPMGHVAVHRDGRVVAGGKYLNANIDKENADWSLIENPYENSSPEDREMAKQYMDMALQDYHPGVHNDLYEYRNEEDSEFFKIDKDFSPQGKRLQDHFDEPKPEPVTKEKVVEGKVFYSPDGGYALSSENWPPNIPEYDKYEWYVFNDNGLSDEEKKMYASLTGLHPTLVTGLDEGVVDTEVDLDVSDGFLFSTPVKTQSEIAFNLTDREPYSMSEQQSGDYKKSVRSATGALNNIKKLTQERDLQTGRLRLSDSLDETTIKDLMGESARFRVTPYKHQKAGIMALTELSQYEAYGGPKGWHGHYLHWSYGSGKTAVVSGANAVMRNRGHIEDGRQTTIVTAPNKNVNVWQGEIGKFLGEHAVVIDGSKEDRIQQWEELLEQAKKEELPSFIVVGSSKFRYRKNQDVDPDDDERWELDLDAQYMKLLSLGGNSSVGQVEGNHVGIFVVDESGQYVNPDAARHSALQEITESVYSTGGITWTLNGDISGNSATDTISELSFINAFVRDNYTDLAMEYTKTNRDTGRESKQMNRRIWKSGDKLRDFMLTYGPQIYSLDGQTVAGEDFGLSHTEDLSAPLGKTWGKIYEQAASKMQKGFAANQMKKTLGLISLMVGSSYGAVAPVRLLEYDLGTNELLEGARNILPPSDFQELKDELKEFYNKATDYKNSSSLGRLPNTELTPSERDNIYKETVSEEYRDALDQVASSWSAPIIDTVLEQIENEIMENSQAGKNKKMGVAGFSKIAINNLYRKLRERYGENKFLIQVVDGDTPSPEVQEIQKNHQKEKDRTVITLVTGAGLYGLSLPADRSWRFPTWNSAKAGQYTGRFHRKAEQYHMSTVVVPDGISQYIRDTENQKSRMAREATGMLLNANDEGEELSILDVGDRSAFLEKLAEYRPRILESE